MAPRLHSSPVTYPFQLCFQLFIVAFIIPNVLAALPHTSHTPLICSTELNALDSPAATLPQYNSIAESKWLSNDEETDKEQDSDGDLESPVSVQLESLEDIVSRRHSTFKLAVLLPYNMTRRNYVFRDDAMLSVTSVSGVIGDTFSWLTEYSAMLTSALSIPQCSFAATSDTLNNKELYATFFRTVSSSGEQGQMMAAYIYSMGWRRVSVLYSDDSYGRSLARTFSTEAAAYGLRILRSEPIYPNGGNEADINDILAALQDVGSYINIIMATDLLILQALEEIQRKGMIGSPYVWLVINDVYNDILGYFSGPYHPAAELFNGLIMLDPHFVDKNEAYRKFEERWLQLDPDLYESAGPGTEVTDMDIRSYSCAWMIALSYVKDMENARARGYSDTAIIDELLYGSYPRTIGNFSAELFSTVTYDGPAGMIKLDKFGNTINLPALFTQIQRNKSVVIATTGSTPDGSHRPVHITGTHMWPGVPVSETPKDGPDWAFQNITWDESAARYIYIMVAIGVAESLVLIAVMLWQRENPVIKAASVLYSVVELLGVMAVYSTVLMRIGVFNDVICIASPMMFSFGFALLIGSLAVKTLREYRLHNNILQHPHEIHERQLLKQLALIVVVFMVPAVVFAVVVHPRVKYIAIDDASDAWVCVQSMGQASGAAQVVVAVLWLIPLPVLTSACALLTRHTQDTSKKWNESRLICYTMCNFLVYSVILIPTIFLDSTHFRISLMAQNVLTVFALQACLLILFGPKIVQMWRHRTERSQSSDLSQTIDDPCSPSFCTLEEQRRYELALKQYGFLSAGKQATPPTSRRRKSSAAIGWQSSIERKTLYFQEPTLKGPVAYNCTTGTLNGPDNNLNNKTPVRQLGSQGVINLHSENTLSMQRHLGQGSQEDEDDAIPVLNETNLWFQRIMRQWRPMRVVVVVSLNLVILADDVKATIEMCLYSRVTPVTEEGHYYLRIHCLEQKSLLLEFNSDGARDQWIQAFEAPTDEVRGYNNNDDIFPRPTGGSGSGSGGSLSRVQHEEMYQGMHRRHIGQNTTIHPSIHSPTAPSDPE
ncbi:hypothetical protein CPC16_001491 [Podila verticillata]|nr:hypothetical protein CPC16_001491 [Podila verticillata]